MTIKIIYYVDTDDNTKTSLMAFDSNKELRDMSVIEKIGAEIELHGFDRRGICNSVAWELAHYGSAQLDCAMGQYDFGIEEIELFT